MVDLFSDRQDWRTIKFGEAVKNINENPYSPRDAGLERSVGLEHIDSDCLRIGRWDPITDGSSFTRRFRKGQVLFGRRRVYLRKVALAEFDGICSSDIYTFEANSGKLLPELLPFIVQSDALVEFAISRSAGTMSPRVKWALLGAFEFQIPTMRIQSRIAEVLWAAENCIKEHERLLDQAITVRKKMHERIFVFISNSQSQPNQNLEAKKLSDIAELITKGATPTSFGFKYNRNGINFIKVESISETGDLILDKFDHIDEETHQFLKRSILKSGDILFSIAGALGRVALVIDEHLPANTNQAVGIIRIKDENEVLREYLKEYLRTPMIKAVVEKSRIVTAQPNVNLSHLRNFPIVFPSLERQEDVLALIKNMDSTIMNVEKSMATVKEVKRSLLNHFLPSCRVN